MYERELAVVSSAALEAAELLLSEVKRPGGPRGSGYKAEVDAEIGSLLCRRINDAFPEEGIVCEEGGEEHGKSGRSFIIDPHDGTHDFLKGRRETSISIGLVDHGELVLGAVLAPFSTELTGEEGLFATWTRGEPVRHNGRDVALPNIEPIFDEGTSVLVSTNLSRVQLRKNRKILSPGHPIRWRGIDVHPDDRTLGGYFGARNPTLGTRAAALYRALIRQ